MRDKNLGVPELRQENWLDLRVAFCWTLAGNTAYAGGQFATLALLAKLVRPEMVGQYALGLALVYPIMQFSNLQLRAVMNSDIREERKFEHYLGLRLLTTVAAFAAILAATRFLGYDQPSTAVILMVGVAYGVETISDVFFARLQLHDRMAVIAKSMMARSLLSVCGLAIVAYVWRSVFWAVASIALARFIVLLSYDRRRSTQGLGRTQKADSQAEQLVPRFNLRVQGKLFWVSLPLGVVVLLASLNSSIPSFFIKSALGNREVAIFAVISLVVSVGNMAVVSLGQATFTRLARAYTRGDLTEFGSVLGKLLACAAALGVAGVVVSKCAGQEILAALFRPEYAQGADLLPWIAATGGVLFMAQFLGFAMTAANLYHSQVVLNLTASVALSTGCYWLIPKQGLQGAIYSMLLAAAMQLVGSALALVLAMRKSFQIAREVEPA